MIKSEELILGDSIKITGDVEIRNGDTIIKAKNKFVQTLLQHLTNIFSNNLLYAGGGGYSSDGWTGPLNNQNIYIGADTTTPTDYNTTALILPIGTVPGTAPNTIIGSTSNPSNGVFRMTITATWIAGAVSGTVGEMALYLRLYPAGNLKPFGWSIVFGSPYSPASVILVSRLAAADGAFSPFAINTANPLAITWTIGVSF